MGIPRLTKEENKSEHERAKAMHQLICSKKLEIQKI